ncbi:hypothetical protein NDU88_000582 [Pleurodeles waltl]|uniref:Uncharacterized protein n=1 Tax=Pleurodeles waltl TaxID=8319 RepID=A0AAV7TFH0_PLEWA|nr:hypothetical protein NDU88_000582 [Pleurodeles waltl]
MPPCAMCSSHERGAGGKNPAERANPGPFLLGARVLGRGLVAGAAEPLPRARGEQGTEAGRPAREEAYGPSSRWKPQPCVRRRAALKTERAARERPASGPRATAATPGPPSWIVDPQSTWRGLGALVGLRPNRHITVRDGEADATLVSRARSAYAAPGPGGRWGAELDSRPPGSQGGRLRSFWRGGLDPISLALEGAHPTR